MASGIRGIQFILHTDMLETTVVKVVGSTPELGNWRIEDAPTLKFEMGSRTFRLTVRFDKVTLAATDPLNVEYKYVACKPTSAKGGVTSEEDWQWLPGENRKVTLEGIHTEAVRSAFPTLMSKLHAPVHVSHAGFLPRVVNDQWVHSRDGTLVIQTDPYLEAHRDYLKHRYHLFTEELNKINLYHGGLDKFSRGWEYYGFNRVMMDGAEGIMFREWAPAALELSLVGDFNGWDHTRTPCSKDSFGVFSVFLPDTASGESAIPHNSHVKLSLVTPSGERVTRMPAWTRYAVYGKELNEYCARYWCPPASEQHSWTNPRPRTFLAADYSKVPGIFALPPAYEHNRAMGAGIAAAAKSGVEAPEVAPAPAPAPEKSHRRGQTGMQDVRVSDRAKTYASKSPTGGAGEPVSPEYTLDRSHDPAHSGLRVYEAHVGMSSDEPCVASYRHFADNVLPRIKRGGYNCVQLMAIMEHAYYGSFGYHVTSFMAASSRFGTPEDLKYLVDKAHGMGLLIIMDLVHSHAAKNVNDGLNNLDGTPYQYFHDGPRGSHDLWDSRLFDYSKTEVQRFLLSSARWFIEEYQFDGYRFDGITSMMYHHHGLSVGFSGGYHEYFGDATDLSAIVYLMLTNYMLHSLAPPVLTIAEDVSGMPTLCRPVWEGGVGFDYRLAMAIPDKWIQLLKEKRDEEWDLGNLLFTLTNRRWQEKTIAYAESHDQALVGDKTLAFWLMDKEMYWHMSSMETPRHPVIDRGLALHKMIRLITFALGGDAYLNFMGNEFGHPEWIDFPREGNSWSYAHCRRQWKLVDDDLLLYKHLAAFDRGMMKLEEEFPWLLKNSSYISLKHEADKLVVFDLETPSGALLFVFNFHATNSYPDYRIGAPRAGCWTVALDSDWPEYGGHGRVARDSEHHTNSHGYHDRPHSIQVYAPSRSAQVYRLKA